MPRSQRHMRVFQGRDAGGTTFGGRKAPLVATRPTIAGTVAVGQTLTGTNGTFTAVAAGGANSAITREWIIGTKSGGVGATYVIVTADKGRRIEFVNYSSNRFGKRRNGSLPTILVP